MKILFCLLAFICTLQICAQNYLISFAGSGASTTVSTVKVENLMSGTSLTINGTDILRLTGTTNINPIEKTRSSELTIYPNPTDGNAIIRIKPPIAGFGHIKVFNMSGTQVAQFQKELDNSPQEFRLIGIPRGFYLIQVTGKTYNYSGKILSNGNIGGNISIEEMPPNHLDVKEKPEPKLKNAMTTIDMAYTNGDRLKFTGSSGIYSTVLTDIPSSNKTITFNFIPCTDGDNNNYPIVQIGPQTWMAENLKTTKYNDGTAIPNVTENIAWFALTTGAYSDYNSTPSNSVTYGRLYNWYVVDNNPATKVASNGGKNVCPTGWHVPSDVEWTAHTTYLGGESVAGGKLKETGTTHWLSPNTGATNENVFTALPGGFRDNGGSYGDVGIMGVFWGSTETSTTTGWGRYVYYSNISVNIANSHKATGQSVRCIKDQGKTEEALITSAGGTFSFFNDSLVLNIPANAVESPTLISIKNIKNDLPIEIESHFINAYELLPHGLKFKEPIETTIHFQKDLQFDNSPDVLNFDITSGIAWRIESLFDTLNLTLKFDLEHFSYVGTNPGWKFQRNEIKTYTTINSPENYLEYGNISQINIAQLVKGDVIRAFNKWQIYSEAMGIKFEEASENADIIIKFLSEKEAKEEFPNIDPIGGGPLGGGISGRVLTYLWNTVSEKRWILINDDEALKLTTTEYYSRKGTFDNPVIGGSSPELGQTSIEGVVLHEIGHFFGLDDEYNANSVKCDNYLSVMGDYYCGLHPVSLFKYDIDNLRDKYSNFLNPVVFDYGSAYNIQPLQSEILPTYVINLPQKGINEVLYDPILVKITDIYGKIVPSVTVVFNYGSQSIGILSNSVDLTDENGIAKLDRWTMPNTPGNYSIYVRAWLDPIDLNTRCEADRNKIEQTVIYNITVTENSGGTITDVEGNVYKTIQIGAQTWMAENLKTTKYNDNTAIPNISDGLSWGSVISGAYCNYNNEPTNVPIYGRLYNWYAINTNKICPIGWHVPSFNEWTELTDFLGGINIAGGKMKETGTLHWGGSNTGATNESGFTGLPGGWRLADGSFYGIEGFGNWWSSSESDTRNALSRVLNYATSKIYIYDNSKNLGGSIRCLKN